MKSPLAEAAQLFRFLVVGVSNTLITLAIVLFLIRFLELGYIIANVIGYVAGFVNGFIWNRKWTFKSKGGFRRQVVFYILAWAVAYGVQMGALVTFRELLQFSAEWATVAAVPFYTGVNYALNRFVTFSEKASDGSNSP